MNKLVLLLILSLGAFTSLAQKNDTIRTINGNREELKISNKRGQLIRIIRLENGKKQGIQEEYVNGQLSQKLTYTYFSKLDSSLLNGLSETYSDHELHSKGIYKKGKKDGSWMEHNSNRIRVKTSYKEGLKNGTETEYHSNGSIMSSSHYKIIKVDTVQKSVLHGEYLFFTNTGEPLTKGTYKNGLKEGLWKYWSTYVVNAPKSTLSSITYYKNDQKGRFEEYNIKGQLKRRGEYYKAGHYSEKPYNYGLHGKYETYDEQGVLQEVSNYNNGLMEGPQFSYRNGKLHSQSERKHNALTGTEIYYDEAGRKTYEKNFTTVGDTNVPESVEDGYYRTWKDGVLTYESFYIKGKQNGITRKFYDNGQLSDEIPTRDGLMVGTHRSYFKNGNVQSIREYCSVYKPYEKKYSSESCGEL